ncbi:MAG: MFS transporter [Paracoccaceae bacterium]
MSSQAMSRNIALYPWHQFLHNMVFWQATWFLYFQGTLSAAEALLLYAIYDVSVTLLEVPSGYMSDRVGRRFTLICAGLAYVGALILLGLGTTFTIFALAQIMLGAGGAFLSGTNTALLYQSLVVLGRKDDMEAQSLRAWRFGFIALGLSAVTGGAFALWWPSLPFLASAIALAGATLCAITFTEPPSTDTTITERARLQTLLRDIRKPVLLWLFALGTLMYGYSHLPFVFGQPFIQQTLTEFGLATQAPLVSGTITAIMMTISVLVSLIAPSIRKKLGLFSLLILAFAIQVGLSIALALFGSVFAIALLVLRMVPDSLSTPFILAHIQPLLGDEIRATFLSIKSFAGRLLFALSIAAAAGSTTAAGQMPLADIQSILWIYAIAGTAALLVLIACALRIK